MKKTLCIILAFLMLLSCTAMAESTIVLTAEYEYVSEENGYVVFGETTDTRSNDKITVEAMLDGSVFDTVITQTKSENGKMAFKTDVIPVEATKTTGEITFKVYSAHAGNSVTIDKDEIYYGVGDLRAILKSLQTALENNDYSTFKSTAVTNQDKLGVEGDLLNSFSGEAQTVAQTLAMTIVLDIPDNVTDAGNSDKVLNQLIHFRNEFIKVTLFGEFASASAAASFSSWYGKYKDNLALEAYNKNLYDAYFKDNYTKEAYFEILNGEAKAITDYTVLKERLLEAGALCYVIAGNANSVNKVFTDFSGKIPTAVTASNILAVYGELAGNEFVSFDKLGNKYDELARAQGGNTTVNNGQNGSANGGDGGGGGSVTSSNNELIMEVPAENTVIEPTAPAVTLMFKDLSGAIWAYDAIKELYVRGIVAGKTQEAFMPNDNITRAEYIKMLVAAGNIQLEETMQVFPDVKPDDWFYSYVNIAYKMNIVTGDSTGYFNPDEKITRQDMTVMLYRMIGNNSVGGDLSVFTDGGSVSDYAKSAVAYLNYIGAVSGMGDGTFAPFANATRAQAAQMIYNVLGLLQ